MNKRRQLILDLLRGRRGTYTLTEIYNELYFSYGINVSRKTIERDLTALHRQAYVSLSLTGVKKYSACERPEGNITLDESSIKDLVKKRCPENVQQCPILELFEKGDAV